MEFLDFRKRNFFRKNELFEQILTNPAKVTRKICSLERKEPK